MIEFGEILRELRTDKKLTQPQLAEAIGVSKSMISMWETGINEPTASNIMKLSKFFDVTTDYLLGLSLNKRWWLLLKNWSIGDKAKDCYKKN